MSFLTRNARTALGATDNYYTFASDYGDVTAYWHGVDVNVNARMSNGLVVQGGTSSGRGVRDFCDILDDLPELYLLPPPPTRASATGSRDPAPSPSRS